VSGELDKFFLDLLALGLELLSFVREFLLLPRREIILFLLGLVNPCASNFFLSFSK